jgi:dihydroneopterin aldolase
VFSVNIRIEKLDIVPGSVGIEIKRERRKSSANVHQLFPGLVETGKPS